MTRSSRTTAPSLLRYPATLMTLGDVMLPMPWSRIGGGIPELVQPGEHGWLVTCRRCGATDVRCRRALMHLQIRAHGSGGTAACACSPQCRYEAAKVVELFQST